MLKALVGGAKRLVRKRKGYVLPPLVSAWSPNHSSRRGQRVNLVVVHDTEGGYAGSVSWLRNPNARASAHVVIREDGKHASQLVGWEDKAWACADYNSESDNIEMAGYAAKPYPLEQLGAYPLEQLGVTARVVAYRLHKRGLPPVHSTSRGFCYHSDLGAAGGGHHDPALSAAQRKWFEAQVKYEYERGGFRDTWGAAYGPAV